jgi:hypothetical protein
MKYRSSSQSKQGGYLLILVLVFSAIFITILTSFVSFVVIQSRLISQRVEFEQAGQIAEAGLNYYKWFLAHYPNDMTNGTGGPGPYVGVYSDPEGAAIGQYSLSVASTTFCGDIASISVVSEGYTYDNPAVRRTIRAQYARPNVAEFSFLLNTAVWSGPDRVITGPYHSNGGVRMDSRHNSVVTSGQSTWTCTSSFGCSPSGSRNGVFTTTSSSTPSLFEFPSAPINFAGITVNLANMKTRAQSNGGIYLAPSGAFGYAVTINATNSITVRRVTNTYSYSGEPDGTGNVTERHIVQTTAVPVTYSIPASCPLIFVEDKVWLSGVVNNKVTIAAADTDTPGVDPSMILQGNITYVSATSSGLLAIAEQDMLIGVDVPDNMTTNGIYVAQNGRFARNHYEYSELPDPPGSLDFRPFYERNSHTMNGTIVSNGRVGTQWVSGTTFVSGFRNRINTYDRNLVLNPPPLIPVVSDVYEFREWRDAN